MDKYYLDPDYRVLAPEKGLYCSHCQKPIKDISKAITVTIDYNTMECWLDSSGTEYIGAVCWAKITK